MTNGLQLAADIASEEDEDEDEEEQDNDCDDPEAERHSNKALIGANGGEDDSDGFGEGVEDGSGAESDENGDGAFKGTGKGVKGDKSRKGTGSRKAKVRSEAVADMRAMPSNTTQYSSCSAHVAWSNLGAHRAIEGALVTAVVVCVCVLLSNFASTIGGVPAHRSALRMTISRYSRVPFST